MHLLLVVLVGCSDGSKSPAHHRDTASAHPDDTIEPPPSWCDTAIEVTYENWGRGFLSTHCQGCHASTAPDRYSAPETVTFDNEDEVIQWASRVLARVIDDGTMPPAGGVNEDEKVLLSSWLECAEY